MTREDKYIRDVVANWLECKFEYPLTSKAQEDAVSLIDFLKQKDICVLYTVCFSESND